MSSPPKSQSDVIISSPPWPMVEIEMNNNKNNEKWLKLDTNERDGRKMAIILNSENIIY